MQNASNDPDKMREIERLERSAMQRLSLLTANLMRIARGKGDPREVYRQIVAYALETQAYMDIVKFDFSTVTISDALKVYKPCPESLGDHMFAVDSHNAYESAISGALQVAASRLQGDHLREAQGTEEMFRAFEQWRERGK